MGGRGTHITCKVTLTALSHFGDHRAACKSTEKGSGGPEIYSALGVPGLYRCARARRAKLLPGGLACAARLARSSLADIDLPGSRDPDRECRPTARTLEASFSAVSTPIFATKYSLVTRCFANKKKRRIQ